MIFVTVGEQLPFDRLVRAMDQWALHTNHRVVAQIGCSDFKPAHIEHRQFMAQEEFGRHLRDAHLIVAHAGMGTIISALEMGKPLVVMPRKSTLGEHRNDHQLATARRFASLGTVRVVQDELELHAAIDTVLSGTEQGSSGQSCAQPSPELIRTIRDFILSTEEKV